MLREKVKVTRDVHSSTTKTVPPWEIPLLEFIHDEGNVIRLGEFERTDAPYPDPRVEYDRLEKAYGADTKSGVPHVASVYGSNMIGLRALRREIAAAQREDQSGQETPATSEDEPDALLA